MATLEARLNALAAAIGADVKALKLADGTLSNLSTTAKTNLVLAINEVYTMATAGTGVINDAALLTITDKAWSVKKTNDTIAAAIVSLRDELRAGAGAALDTFAEVAAQLAADESAASALATAVANRVRYDAAQALNTAQQLQACTNIGVGNPDVDLAAAYVTAKT